MADLLDTVRTEINARLEELRPIVQEAAGLEAALNALGGAEVSGTRSSHTLGEDLLYVSLPIGSAKASRVRCASRTRRR